MKLFIPFFRYYPAIEKFVKKVTGAQHVFCFDHNLRSSTYVEQKNTQSKTQKPIPQVHTDYTPTSAPRRLLDLTKNPKANDTYALFRYIKTVTKKTGLTKIYAANKNHTIFALLL